MNGQQEQAIFELTAEMADIRAMLARQLQSSPSITGKAAALVALAKDSRLDGRIGAGDVVVSVMLAAGGSSIGVFGAAGIQFGNLDFMSTGECYGLCALSGCTLGILRMGIDALAVPMMLSSGLEWLAERWQEWREDQKEIALAALSNRIVERPVFLNPGEDMPKMWDIYDTPLANYKIEIKKGTDKAKPVVWSYAKLWYFIEDCHRTGEWSRAKSCARWGSKNLSQGEHKAISDFIKAKCRETETMPELWGLCNDLPTLEAYLERFRMPLTNQPAN